jgi:hypothetical protein
MRRDIFNKMIGRLNFSSRNNKALQDEALWRRWDFRLLFTAADKLLVPM